MSVWIKACGVRRAEDLRAAVAAGVDAVGFNFWPRSKRYLPPHAAADLVRLLPPSVLPVGVFVGASADEVAHAVRDSGVRAAQLHGDEDPARYRDVGAELIQVLRVRPGGALPAGPVDPAVGRVLLDAWVAGFGGQGASFDWALARGAGARLGRPVLIAGGLTPLNVAAAIRIARPWGVDVASGVESAPGLKDPAKLREFVEAARGAAQEAVG